MKIEDENTLNELSWRIIHNQKLTPAEHELYSELCVTERLERLVAVTRWSSGGSHVGKITPQ